MLGHNWADNASKIFSEFNVEIGSKPYFQILNLLGYRVKISKNGKIFKLTNEHLGQKNVVVIMSDEEFIYYNNNDKAVKAYYNLDTGKFKSRFDTSVWSHPAVYFALIFGLLLLLFSLQFYIFVKGENQEEIMLYGASYKTSITLCLCLIFAILVFTMGHLAGDNHEKRATKYEAAKRMISDDVDNDGNTVLNLRDFLSLNGVLNRDIPFYWLEPSMLHDLFKGYWDSGTISDDFDQNITYLKHPLTVKETEDIIKTHNVLLNRLLSNQHYFANLDGYVVT